MGDFFGVRWLDTAFFLFFLSFSLSVCRAERKDQSGVNPPHSKELVTLTVLDKLRYTSDGPLSGRTEHAAVASQGIGEILRPSLRCQRCRIRGEHRRGGWIARPQRRRQDDELQNGDGPGGAEFGFRLVQRRGRHLVGHV